MYDKIIFLGFCVPYPEPENNGELSISDGRRVTSVATVKCNENYYPSTTNSIPGHAPNITTGSSTCTQYRIGPNLWSNGILKCVPGNININTPDAILAQW